MRIVKRDLRRVPFEQASRTQPKLEAIPGAPIVTWNTSGIDALPTRQMRVTQGSGALFWVNVALCALVLLALVAMAVLLVSYPPF